MELVRTRFHGSMIFHTNPDLFGFIQVEAGIRRLPYNVHDLPPVRVENGRPLGPQTAQAQTSPAVAAPYSTSPRNRVADNCFASFCSVDRHVAAPFPRHARNAPSKARMVAVVAGMAAAQQTEPGQTTPAPVVAASPTPTPSPARQQKGGTPPAALARRAQKPQSPASPAGPSSAAAARACKAMAHSRSPPPGSSLSPPPPTSASGRVCGCDPRPRGGARRRLARCYTTARWRLPPRRRRWPTGRRRSRRARGRRLLPMRLGRAWIRPTCGRRCKRPAPRARW
jgi:hypothetical protein